MKKELGLAVGLFIATLLLPAQEVQGKGFEAQAPLVKSACSAGPLGLCSDYDAGLRVPQALRGWYRLGLNVKKAMPNKFMQLVQLFIDDLKVAETSNMKIKLSISIR